MLTKYGGADTLRGCGACNLLGVSNPGLNGTKAGFCAGALWKPGRLFRWGVTTYASAAGIGISSGFLLDSKPSTSCAASCLLLSSASSSDSRLSSNCFSDLLRSSEPFKVRPINLHAGVVSMRGSLWQINRMVLTHLCIMSCGLSFVLEAPELRLRLTGSELSLLLGASMLPSLFPVRRFSPSTPSTSTSVSSSQPSVLMRTEQQSAGLFDCLNKKFPKYSLHVAAKLSSSEDFVLTSTLNSLGKKQRF